MSDSKAKFNTYSFEQEEQTAEPYRNDPESYNQHFREDRRHTVRKADPLPNNIVKCQSVSLSVI